MKIIFEIFIIRSGNQNKQFYLIFSIDFSKRFIEIFITVDDFYSIFILFLCCFYSIFMLFLSCFYAIFMLFLFYFYAISILFLCHFHASNIFIINLVLFKLFLGCKCFLESRVLRSKQKNNYKKINIFQL